MKTARTLSSVRAVLFSVMYPEQPPLFFRLTLFPASKKTFVRSDETTASCSEEKEENKPPVLVLQRNVSASTGKIPCLDAAERPGYNPS